MPNVVAPRWIHNRSLTFSTAQALLYQGNNATLGWANSWTMMAIVKPVGNTSTWFTGVGSSAGSNMSRFGIAGASNAFNVELRTSANAIFKQYTYTALGTFNSNVWQHVVFTWDGTTLQGYLNGVAVSPTTITTDNAGTQTDPGTSSIGVGTDATNATRFGGQVNQVAWWNTPLAADEVASLYNGGAVAHLDLRSSFGTYVSQLNLRRWYLCGFAGIYTELGFAATKYDLTTNAPGGVTEAANAVGEYMNGTGYVVRLCDASIDMDGSTERLRSSTARTLGFANTWTAWSVFKSARDGSVENVYELKTGGSHVNQLLFSKRGDLTNNPLEVMLGDSGGSTIRDYFYDSVLPVGVWVSVVSTWDGSTLVTWINGVKRVLTSQGGIGFGSMTDTTRVVGFGISPDVINFFAGNIHTAAMWNAVLPDSEIAIISDPVNASWFNPMTNGLGYNSKSSLAQWWRCGIGSQIGTTGGQAWVANEFGTLVNLNEGSSNLTYAGDVVLDFPR